ncbi:hypothetical protein SERLA73DRAFT_173623 [Serpula lacrymans var. lacrymans S7.3]|uniref:Uncharacterized protein n=1 Tax=Serpula lacrymans var. lacrymans (strain S7.3) TaxID=936435 RepID=F8PF81_SERL3|nr:hypothetical protein SERLA73DRAFT_173623 [Serpula lacrymans var. lacrymans S7.3]
MPSTNQVATGCGYYGYRLILVRQWPSFDSLGRDLESSSHPWPSTDPVHELGNMILRDALKS